MVEVTDGDRDRLRGLLRDAGIEDDELALFEPADFNILWREKFRTVGTFKTCTSELLTKAGLAKALTGLVYAAFHPPAAGSDPGGRAGRIIGPPSGHYVVSGVLRDARRVRGAHAALYMEAGNAIGYHPTPSHTDTFRYEDDDLHFRVAFPKQSSAARFLARLEDINTTPTVGFHNKLESLAVVPERGSLQINDLVRISQYKHTEHDDSPGVSLEDNPLQSPFQSACGRATFLPKDDPAVQYQSLESERWLGGINTQECRILAAGCTADPAEEEHNILALSPDLHQRFDGIGRQGMPTIAIKPGFAEDEFDAEPGVKRRRLNVELECFDRATALAVWPTLKGHSDHSESSLIAKSWVCVRDADVMTKRLWKKYEATKELWMLSEP